MDMEEIYKVPGKSTAQSILEAFQAWTVLTLGEVETVTYDGEEFTDADEIIERIREEPLSVLVSYGWVQPGQLPKDGPEEYEILLGTGGPAVRIIGKLDQYCQPKTAILQGQDWFKPWQATATSSEEDEAVQWYAELFYFGE